MDIGKEKEPITVEPVPETVPVSEPSPEPVKAPEPEKVPA